MAYRLLDKPYFIETSGDYRTRTGHLDTASVAL